MFDTRTHAVAGAQIVPLDDQTLASIVGGDGPIEWFFKKVGELVFECITGNLDEVISAAKDGYTDAR